MAFGDSRGGFNVNPAFAHSKYAGQPTGVQLTSAEEAAQEYLLLLNEQEREAREEMVKDLRAMVRGAKKRGARPSAPSRLKDPVTQHVQFRLRAKELFQERFDEDLKGGMNRGKAVSKRHGRVRALVERVVVMRLLPALPRQAKSLRRSIKQGQRRGRLSEETV